MPVRVVCPSCATQLNVKDEHAGRAVRCPKCGTVIPPPQPATSPPPEPPAPAAPPAFEPATPPKPPARPPTDDNEDAPRRLARRSRDDDDDEADDRRRPRRPRPRRRDDDDEDVADRPATKSNLPLVLGIVAGVLLLCCGGVGFGVYWLVLKVQEKAQEVAGQLEKWNPAVTPANYHRVKLNMTRAQVEGILGLSKPLTADELAQALGGPDRPRAKEWVPKARENKVLVWRNGDDFILACFYPDAGANGKVQAKAWEPKTGIGSASDGALDDKKYLEQYSKIDPGGPAGPAVQVSAVDLGRAYQDDPAEADTRYKDKVLVVEGKLGDVTQRAADLVVQLLGPPPPAGKAVGTMVFCQFDNAAGKRAWLLSRGQTVKVRGKCAGSGGPGVNLLDCQIESSGPDPSVTLSATMLGLEHARDAAAADEKYKDKAITLLNATVECKDNSALVLVGLSKKGAAAKIKATWPTDSRAQLDAVKAGDRVRMIKGGYGGSADGTIFLNRCWLVP